MHIWFYCVWLGCISTMLSAQGLVSLCAEYKSLTWFILVLGLHGLLEINQLYC